MNYLTSATYQADYISSSGSAYREVHVMSETLSSFDLLRPVMDEQSARLKMSNALWLLQLGLVDMTQAAAVLRDASEAVYRSETRH